MPTTNPTTTSMKIYISGKITGLPTDEAKAKFWHAARWVERMHQTETNVHTIDPFDIKPLLGIKKYWCFMAADIWKLIRCDAAYFMQNWKESRGARIERKICEFFKIRIIEGAQYELSPDFELDCRIYHTWTRIQKLKTQQTA